MEMIVDIHSTISGVTIPRGCRVLTNEQLSSMSAGRSLLVPNRRTTEEL